MVLIKIGEYRINPDLLVWGRIRADGGVALHFCNGEEFFYDPGKSPSLCAHAKAALDDLTLRDGDGDE